MRDQDNLPANPGPGGFAINRRRLFTAAGATVAAAGPANAMAAAKGAASDAAGALVRADYADLGEAENGIVDPRSTFLRTAGRTRPGDGGSALFVRADREPGHAGKLRTADGSWWEMVLEDRLLDYRAFGTGSSAINDAIAFVSAVGGGTVLIPESTTVSGRIVARDRVRLWLPPGVILGLDAPVNGGFVHGRDVADFQIAGGGCIRPNGHASYAVRLRGRSRFPIDGLEITNHKGGVRIEASSASGIGDCAVRDLWIHDNFVHPRQPAWLSEAGHGLSISCRPSRGYDLTEKVVLENVTLEGVAAGATDGSNQYTKDLLSVQGAKILWIDKFVSRRSGEVGLSATFGCQQVTIQNALVEDADGNGIVLSGSHYRLDLVGVSGPFLIGETVTGRQSGATGVVEYFTEKAQDTAVMWLKLPSRHKMLDQEGIIGATSRSSAATAKSWPSRILEVSRSVSACRNGIDRAGTGRMFAGVAVRHVEQANFSGTYIENNNCGMISGSSDYFMGDYHSPMGQVQITPFKDVGESKFIGRSLGPVAVANPATASGQGQAGVLVNSLRQIEAVQSGAAAAILNRTGSTGAEDGDVLQISRNGVVALTLGTDGVLLPQRDAGAAFTHSSLPPPAGVPHKTNFSSDSRGGSPAIVRSDGRHHVDMVSGLPSRAGAWDKLAIEAEAGEIVGGTAYVRDAAGGNPALSVWTGAGWRHIPLDTKAGTVVIARGELAASIGFATPFAGTDYAVTLTAHGADPVWIGDKTAAGITVHRASPAERLAIDWVAIPHADL